MVESLAAILSFFSGEANRARCLAHIVNLVVKIILRQFDTTKANKKKDEPVAQKTAKEMVQMDDIEMDDDSDEDLDEYDEKKERVLDKEEKEMLMKTPRPWRRTLKLWRR
jgi:hypothetical protein